MENTGPGPLELDLARAGRAAGWALLVAAVLFAAHAGTRFAALKGEIADAESRLAKVAAARADAARRSPPIEVSAVREAAQRLSLPWPDLFKALEAAASDDVALLALEPDPKTGTVLITADTLDYLAALAYVRSLAAGGALSQVHLVRHEWKGGAMQFTVSANWLQRRVQGSQ